MKARYCFLLLFLSVSELFSQNLTDGSKQLVKVSSKRNVEFSPTISADGRTLIFETQKNDKWELYQSHLTENNEWSQPYPLTKINEKCSFIAGPNLSYDGNTIYYTAFIEGVTKSEDIYYSERLTDNQWSEPKSAGSAINTEVYEGFPSISADGNSLYFISMTEENINDKRIKDGCFTIYVSHKQSDGSWGDPVALPDIINSGCERDPKIMADNRTLIFSSVKPEGKGKYDLFQARLMPDHSWTTPVPLDFVNSDENDQSPCISASGNKMFFFSDDDIYEIPIPQSYRQLINITVYGTVLSQRTNKPVRAIVTAKNTKTGEIFSLPNNASDGKYTLVLAAGQSFELLFESEGYMPEKTVVDYSKQENYLEEKKDILLRSDFKLSLAINDKDLKIPVNAFVKIIEPGVQTIFEDSLSVSKSFDLQSTSDYEILVAAPGYPDVRQKFKYDVASSQNQIEKIIELVHEKISAVTEVTDIRSGQKMKMKVTYNNQDKDEIIIAEAGETIFLRKGDRYQVVTNSEGGYAYAITTVRAGEDNGPLKLNMGVTQLYEGAKLSLEHIYFPSNSSDLNENSTLELRSIIHLLKRYPEMIIEISAHTDNVGSDDYNFGLSQKRAMSVTSYLSKSGIPLKQLMAKGYGKTHPLVPNDTEENKAKNRRVELLVLKVK